MGAAQGQEPKAHRGGARRETRRAPLSGAGQVGAEVGTPFPESRAGEGSRACEEQGDGEHLWAPDTRSPPALAVSPVLATFAPVLQVTEHPA